MSETIYPGIVIGTPSVTPTPDDQVNQPVSNIISPEDVKPARPM